MITIVGLRDHHAAILGQLQQNPKMKFQDLLQIGPVYSAAIAVNTTVGASPLPPVQGSSAQHVQLSDADVKRNLDTIWDEQESVLSAMTLRVEDYARLVRCMQATLLDHQIQGLAWMLGQEIGGETTLPPFYTEKKASSKAATYCNAITKHDYATKPAHFLGGLLAGALYQAKLSVIAAAFQF